MVRWPSMLEGYYSHRAQVNVSDWQVASLQVQRPRLLPSCGCAVHRALDWMRLLGLTGLGMSQS